MYATEAGTIKLVVCFLVLLLAAEHTHQQGLIELSVEVDGEQPVQAASLDAALAELALRDPANFGGASVQSVSSAPSMRPPVVPCSPGSFFDYDRQACAPCPAGTYNPSTGVVCFACPNGTVSGPGAAECAVVSPLFCIVSVMCMNPQKEAGWGGCGRGGPWRPRAGGPRRRRDCNRGGRHCDRVLRGALAAAPRRFCCCGRHCSHCSQHKKRQQQHEGQLPPHRAAPAAGVS